MNHPDNSQNRSEIVSSLSFQTRVLSFFCGCSPYSGTCSHYPVFIYFYLKLAPHTFPIAYSFSTFPKLQIPLLHFEIIRSRSVFFPRLMMIFSNKLNILRWIAYWKSREVLHIQLRFWDKFTFLFVIKNELETYIPHKMDNAGQARQVTPSHNWMHGKNVTQTLNTGTPQRESGGFPPPGIHGILCLSPSPQSSFSFHCI